MTSTPLLTRWLRVLAIGALLSACAHAPADVAKRDRSSGLDLSSIAARYHVPRCEVSVPMTQDEALRHLERWYLSHPEQRSGWGALVAATRPGDQLREVICLGAGADRTAYGDTFLGLFRDGAMVAEMHYVIIN